MSPAVLAADLGGTKCRFAVVSAEGRVLGLADTKTTRDPKAFLAALMDGLEAARTAPDARRHRPVAIGVGTAGVIATDHGSIRNAPNLPVAGLPLAKLLQDRFDLPAALVNDGRASAMGEALHGQAAGKEPLLVLFFGTGIGIGLIVNGKPYEGATNAAGEIGHTIHVPGGRLCPCGQRGCYEAYCGGGPIVARATEELGPRKGKDPWDLRSLRKLAATDARAAAIVADCERAATALVASACTLLNPAAVVLGGGVLQKGWPGLARKIAKFVREHCTPSVRDHLTFVPALEGSDAILLGAAGFALEVARRR